MQSQHEDHFKLPVTNVYETRAHKLEHDLDLAVQQLTKLVDQFVVDPIWQGTDRKIAVRNEVLRLLNKTTR